MGARLYDKVMTIFGATMVFFYLGLAYILLFTPTFAHVDIALRVIFAVPLGLYGGFRTVIAYQKIKENFFDKYED